MKRINGAESQIRPEAVRQHPASFIADKMKLFWVEREMRKLLP